MRVGWFERTALKHVYYPMWDRSPVHVRCMRQGAQGWCTRMALRDGLGREVGGGSGWGAHVHPWRIHVNVWQKPSQISFQLKKNRERDITLPTKVCLVKAMDFLVVMYGCESWIIKKAEHRRIDAFELCCWRRLLRVPWRVGRSNQSILKEISPEY